MRSLSGKKILYVITKSNWGGAQKYVHALATGAKAAGAEVAVALGGEGELKTQLKASGIEVFSLGMMQRDLSLARDTGGLTQLRRVFRIYKPDLVHLNSSKAGVLGALAARLEGVPQIIFTAHGWPFAEKRNILWRLIALLGSYLTALACDTVIVVSKTDLKSGRLMPFAAGKMRLIHNGIDLPMQFGSGDVIRSAFPSGAHITGTIGELNRNKNQIELIEQARHNPQMFVAIVGEGELRGYLERKIAEYGLTERVKLFGFLPAAEVLKGFDVFSLPSRKEGFPYVLIEARAAGLPIKARRVGGIPDILDAVDLNEFSTEKMLEKTFSLY